MTDNEIISKARGECRHEDAVDVGIAILDMRCPCGAEAREPHTMSELYPIPDYSNDPAAWTPELYQFIEDEGLQDKFIEYLKNIVDTHWPKASYEFDLIKSTEAQRARALAMALKERDV